jgi:hypothetical protein
MLHGPRSRSLPRMPIRDPSSLVLWFLLGVALVSLVFTTRQIPKTAQNNVALNATSTAPANL